MSPHVVDAAGASFLRRRNLIGPVICRLRFQRGWTQEDLVTQLDLLGAGITRDVIANLESGRSSVTDVHIRALARAFAIHEGDFFPPRISPSSPGFDPPHYTRP